MRHNTVRTTQNTGFTLIELLVVIAIIAILAAILFPIFGTVREQARQSSTMSNMQSIYQSVRLYYEDEQRYPTALFGYVQTCTIDNGVCIPYSEHLATPDEIPSPAHPTFSMQQNVMVNPLYPYLYKDQAKNLPAFYSGDESVSNTSEYTPAYYPINSPFGLGANSRIENGRLANGVLVKWTASDTRDPDRIVHGDADLPNDPRYIDQNKLYYKMDAMDVGPMIDNEGRWVEDGSGNKVYELHYTPDWTRLAGATNDVDSKNKPYVAQLKYKNPPTDKTVITYNTHHAAIGNSGKVITLFLDGRAKKVDLKTALNSFPLKYDQ